MESGDRVTSPLDAMCHVVREATGFPRSRIIGMAGVLDSSRFAAFIGMEFDVSTENISAGELWIEEHARHGQTGILCEINSTKTSSRENT